MEIQILAIIFTIFIWWFSTGIILYAIRRVDYSSKISHKAFTFYCTPLLLIGMVGFIWTLNGSSTLDIYLSFVSSLFIWGWFEIAFLSGVITGKNKKKCDNKTMGWERFNLAWNTINYSELSLLVVTVIMYFLVKDSLNFFGFLTFVTLYLARVSAKINFFVGVPYINFEFFPKPIAHMKSFFKIKPPSFFWIISAAIMLYLVILWGQNAFNENFDQHIKIGFLLISSLTFLALFEHLCMVIPLTETRLWLWMLPKKSKNEN